MALSPLTRDSLVAAKLCYVQAEFLMGKAPSVNAVNRWEPVKLDELLNAGQSRMALEAFEKQMVLRLGDFPLATNADARSGQIGSAIFTAPINDRLLQLFASPGERLDNLRNNRTLDGKPLNIDLFSPPADPKQLLRDLVGGGIGAPRTMGGRVVVKAFRWRVLFDAAMRAAQTLQEFSNQVLSLQERRDQAELVETQQAHLVELGTYAHTLQVQAIDQLGMQVTALEQSKVVAQERADAYSLLFDEDVSTAEYQVMDKIQSSKELALLSTSINAVGATLAALPNIFGVAAGGGRLDAIPAAVAFGLNIAASVSQMEAEKEATTEAYRRRRADWGLQRNQASAEVRAIKEQIKAQEQALRAAQTNLEQTLQANRQALTVHNFLKKRATSAELFNWVLGQVKALNYQVYDAVVSLCLSALASMQAETGDYDWQTPLPQAWLDNRNGLTAGDHLLVWLLRMEQDYLNRLERRLELVRTVSLRQLFDDTIRPQPGIHSWAEALVQLQTKGTLEFCLTQLLFDQDHPGHYCRQISSVEVDVPVVKGPFQDVRATLLQISSKIATKPTAASVKHLHNPENSVAPPDVQTNLRSGQAIVVSTGVADNGMTAQKPDEGLLHYFENTGAVSSWQLKFPWPGKEPQNAMLDSLTDVILRIRYTAKAGDATFTRQVEDLVTIAETPGTNKKGKGAGNHA
ncbi:Tc toxin subunit A-related protein [Pseudomonas sp. LB3P14]